MRKFIELREHSWTSRKCSSD